MARESKKHMRERALEVCRRMDIRYPDAACALNFSNPFTLTIAVLLSAQTTDVAVNKVTPLLFAKWPTPQAMADANPSEIEEIIHSIGFFRTKAKNCVGCARRIITEYAGKVPQTMEELQTLPGVGRKTANIVLNECFDIVDGIAVDTHVFRIAKRLGFTKADTPANAEKDLLELIPKERWKPVNHQWVLFGREVCNARSPHCEACELSDICPSSR